MIRIPTYLFLLLGLIQGMAFGDLDSLLNANGLVSSVLGNMVEGTGNPLDDITNLLNNPEKLNAMYSRYQTTHNKMGAESSSSDKKKTFKAALLKIAKHNMKARAGKASYEMGVTQFTDLTYEDFVKQYTGIVPGNSPSSGSADSAPANPKSVKLSHSLVKRDDDITAPDSIDWRDYGIVTSVKNQKQCGSCALFTTTACLESYYALNNGQWLGKIDLSEQELLDCANGPDYPHMYGCKGNAISTTFKYLKDVGSPLESTNPYMAVKGTCKNNTAYTQVVKYWAVAKNDEDALKTAVGTYGPVAVEFHATNEFQHYKSGVFSDPCPGDINHAVLAIGYGTDSNGTDYWLVKNQWDVTWGEKGFFKIARNKDNWCKIASGPYSCSDTQIKL